MTTTVAIRTVEGDKESNFHVTVTDQAQKHVLRTFNPTADALVDGTKVLCAAIIQIMLDKRNAPDASDAVKRAASTAITQCEALQMQAVKANFVQA